MKITKVNSGLIELTRLLGLDVVHIYVYHYYIELCESSILSSGYLPDIWLTSGDLVGQIRDQSHLKRTSNC